MNNSIEDTEEYRKIEPTLEKMISSYLNEVGIDEYSAGYISIYFGVKKKILKEVFNIDWTTPEEENPDCIFD
ncbi:MAG: hypothetical protein ACI4OG_01230 [Bacilli bacterium]